MKVAGWCHLALQAAWPTVPAALRRGWPTASAEFPNATDDWSEEDLAYMDIGRGRASEMRASVAEMLTQERDDIELEVVLTPQPKRSRREGSSAREESSAPDHKPVFWVHIHKAAGSTMCEMAGANGERLIQPMGPLSNCNWFPHDNNHAWLRKMSNLGRSDLKARNCKQRQMKWKNSKFSWGQIERPFSDEFFCPESFSYGTALRDPVKSVESMLNFHDPLGSPKGPTWENIMGCIAAGAGGGCADAWGAAEDSLWMFFDNPIVRTLGGPEVLNLPFGGVNSEHANFVLDLLKKFNMVLLVEELGSEETRVTFEKSLGWTKALLRHANPSRKKLRLSDAEREAVSNMNRHDYTIYDHFKQSVGGGSVPFSTSPPSPSSSPPSRDIPPSREWLMD